MESSIFDDYGAGSSDGYSPEPKPLKAKKPVVAAPSAPKPKPAPKKTVQTTLKAKPASKKRAKPESDEENSDVDVDSVGDASLLSNTPPSAKRQKKAPALKKSSGKPLQQISNESADIDGLTDKKPKGSKNASDDYQKLSQVEHILKRPDTYIGSVERDSKQMWVYNSQNDSMESREVSYVPGLYKIFDEILVNAADNKQRDKNMDEIQVVVNREKGFISVYNNGRGIPIEIHEKENIYIPEMIFGHLLTGSNYDDNAQKVTGGRNGFGAKLCNVFSKKFMLETADARRKKVYKQTWTNNMSNMLPADIDAYKGDDYTKVTFWPDFTKFADMEGIDDDFEGLVMRRVYDMAGTCKGVKVTLNGKKVKVRDFKKYMELYTKAIKAEDVKSEEEDNPAVDAQVILTDNPHERWEVGFAVSSGSFEQVSFVNSIATTSGGTHVNYVADQIVTKLMDIVKKKDKGGVALKPNQIRNHMFLFVNCLITNPAFTSQTKEQLTTKQSQFGSKCVLSEKFLKDIAKSKVVDNILHFAKQKADQVLKKSDGNKRQRMNHSKLTDANKAGTKDGYKCTLILTEGDSASLLALAGRAVVDPDLIGVFPLRGKLLNVRDASIDSISKNQEIQNIKKFIGLQHKKHYDDTRGLRYGHIMIMTDQDHDGSHIKGLLINFLEAQFPSLLKLPGFLQEFITPIVKVWKGDPKNPKSLKSFFTMPEYERWKEEPGNGRGWEHKYFKGLGTSSPSDAQIYFRDLDLHLKQFRTLQPHEPEMIDLAFAKKKADARKDWLRNFTPGTYLDMTANEITYDDFINKELILFSVADNMRSIPSVVDGFKPGQRKVLYTCFRRNLKKDSKVVDLAGSVSGLTSYPYGDTSMQQTIVGLAQTFVGSNNINTLEPSGNFGSRLQGGADCASARYIYTRLSPFARKIFKATDEALLTYNIDDGKTIEPEVYVPIVPMILINGADGIGTGWSSTIPNYNPEDIVENLKLRMNGEDKDVMKPMKPWFRGWQGEAEDIGQDRFKFTGRIAATGDNEVEITELPVRVWTQDFKDKLEEILKAEKIPSWIKDYTEYNTPDKVHFIIKLEDKHMAEARLKGLEEAFKLSKTMATTNLVAFDHKGRINKYATPLDMLEEFYHVRLQFYQRRKEYLLNDMQNEHDKLSNQARFIRMIVDGQLIVAKKKKAVLVAELKKLGFKPIPKIVDARKEGEFTPIADAEEAEGDEAEEAQEPGANDYDYLLGMAIWSLTEERINKLMKQIGDKEAEIKVLSETTPKDIWRAELDEFIAEWRFQLEDEARRAKKIASMGRRDSKKLRIGGTKGAGKKRKADESEDDSFVVSKQKKVEKSKPKSTSTLLSAFSTVEQKPIARPPAEQQGLVTVVNPTESDEEADAVFHAAEAKAKPPAAVSRITQKARVIEDDDDDDVFTEIAKAADKKPAAGRQARAAAQKRIKYEDSDDDSDGGDDLLKDVGDLVKGVPASTTGDAGASKPLFSNTTSGSRPSSSHGLSKPRASRPTIFSDDDEVDKTDYHNLVPKDSPLKAAPRSGRELLQSDDDDIEMLGMPPAKPSLKPSSKVSTASSKAAQPTTKPSAAPSLKPKKPASPAGKAYQKRLEKMKAGAAAPAPAPAPAKAKKSAPAAKKKSKAVSDDEDGDEIVDQLLSSDDESMAGAAVAEPSARPSRRAAANRKTYTLEDDDDEDGESEPSFQSDGDESD